MNERDSETIAALLEGMSYTPTDSYEDADIILFNTCAVREKPHQKVFSRLGDLKALKARKPDLLVAVCGCMAQIIPDQIAQRAPCVDIILGPRNIAELPALIASRKPHWHRPSVCADTAADVPEGLPAVREPGIGAFVNVAYGCNNFCAYCVVPYARGPEVSRRPQDVVAEVQAVAAAGYLEVTLLGQNVNSYGHDLANGPDFADLLAQVNAVAGIRRIRFTTSHPKDCSRQLLEAMRDLTKVCEHLHLPLQAGSDAVLEAMGRGYTFDHYRGLVELARETVPGIAITTDIIVGFPGETEPQFEKTLAACAEIRYDQAFMFKYNDRPGTRAAGMEGKVPEATKQQRLVRLAALQNEIGRDVNRLQLDSSFEALVEGPDPQGGGQMRGRTRQNKLAIFPGGPELRGKLVRVRAEQAFLWGFKARLDGL